MERDGSAEFALDRFLPGTIDLSVHPQLVDRVAGVTRIAVLRQESTGTRQMPFLYDKLTEKRDPRTSAKTGGTGSPDNFCVQPGDVILVP